MSQASVTATRDRVPGWFGKLPGLGDFAGRRLPDDFVHRWDEWLQAGLAQASRDPDWLARYLVAPIRRFWLAPGLVDPHGWAGLLMPSVDRVGRHFPLTLAQPVPSLAAALAAGDWLGRLDGAARRVLDMDYTVDDFEQALAALAGPPREPPDAASQRLAQALGAALDGGSVWWPPGASQDAEFDCHPGGLPPAPALAAMLGGAP